jgi:putative membrane protein
MTGALVPLHLDPLALSPQLVVLLVWSAGVLLLLAWWYGRGLMRLRRHPQGRRRLRLRPLALVVGCLVTAAALLPPLGTIAEARLSTHMGQHMALVLGSAPLLALGAPGPCILAGMPAGLRRVMVASIRRVPASWLGAPVLAWVLFVGLLWLWHLPGPYDLAVRSDAVHVLEHATFLATAWLFWWHLASPSRRRLEGPLATLYVAAVIPPAGALGAMLTFADQPLYATQATMTAALGADPLLDQRIGGLVMWVPMDVGLIVVAVGLFGHWLARKEQHEALVTLASGSAGVRPAKNRTGAHA